jgi:GNAT superfamily N-acetyltransferase
LQQTEGSFEPSRDIAPVGSACNSCAYEIISEAKMQGIDYRSTGEISLRDILELYKANKWYAAEKPELLHKALLGSETLISAWDGETLVGLGNAISDGHLVVYCTHLLVLPSHHGRGVGREIIRLLKQRYDGFHQHMLVAEGSVVEFYERVGFRRAGKTVPMWIYSGNDH